MYEQNDELLNAVIDPETGEVLTASVADNLNELSTALVAKIKNVNIEVDAYKAEIKRLKEVMDAKKHGVESAKSFLKGLMENNDIKKFEDGIHKVTLRKAVPKLIIKDEGDVDGENAIPGKYISTEKIIVRNIDKKAIKEDLKNGIDVNGAELEWNTSLLIK